jgi:hypothetical protein
MAEPARDPFLRMHRSTSTSGIRSVAFVSSSTRLGFRSRSTHAWNRVSGWWRLRPLTDRPADPDPAATAFAAVQTDGPSDADRLRDRKPRGDLPRVAQPRRQIPRCTAIAPRRLAWLYVHYGRVIVAVKFLIGAAGGRLNSIDQSMTIHALRKYQQPPSTWSFRRSVTRPARAGRRALSAPMCSLGREPPAVAPGDPGRSQGSRAAPARSFVGPPAAHKAGTSACRSPTLPERRRLR